MGNGNWATDPGYAQKVLAVYFQMVTLRRQAQLTPDDASRTWSRCRSRRSI